MLTDMFAVLGMAILGLALSLGVEYFLRPRPPLCRPIGAWQVHVGLWCASYATLVLLMGRLWCSMVLVTAILATLVLVNTAKRNSLREPFLFQDYEYFLDTLFHPRLFLPFLGVKNFLLAAAGFVLALAGFLYEATPASRFAIDGQLGGALLVLTLAALLLWQAARCPLPVCFDPEKDMQGLGLVAVLWAYALAECKLPHAVSPFGCMPHLVSHSQQPLPHLVAIQSESFFDPRFLYTGIHSEVLKHFDSVRDTAFAQGMLSVPAWGANTVRTEFAFLSGIDAQEMGVHRFNPYRPVGRGWPVYTMPLLLKSLGYRTVCVHPYWASFYGRNRVLPRMGFDEFIDIQAFAGAPRAGAYVADAAVGEHIASLMQRASSPTFVFAITMENHGPLQMVQVDSADTMDMYIALPPAGCGELSVYLRHLRNADAMLGGVREVLEHLDCPASLCWYGDHVPIMPSTYTVLGTPAGEVPYVCWRNDCAPRPGQGKSKGPVYTLDVPPLPVHRLASIWLEDIGVR